MTSLAALFQAIPAFITALGQIALLLTQMTSLMNRFVTWSEKNQLAKWMNDLEGHMDKLEEAKSVQEKLDAARGLVDSIHNI